MDKQLELVAKSYDRTIDLGSKGIDLYRDLPDYITSRTTGEDKDMGIGYYLRCRK